MTASASRTLASPGAGRPVSLVHAFRAPATPLVLVLALAALLRLAGLGHAPLWGDEAATAAFAHLPWSDLLAGIGRLEPNPPTFYAAEKLWTALAGSSDLALRLPAALCGIASVVILWRLTRLAFGTKPALWAAFLTATFAHPVEHARDARVYAVLLMATAVAALVARSVATRPALQTAIVLSLLVAAICALHATGIIVAATVLAYAAVLTLHPGNRASGEVPEAAPTHSATRRLLTLAVAGLAGIILAAPALYPLLLISADKTNNAAWIPVPDMFMAIMFTVNTWAAPYAGLRLLPLPLTLAGLVGGAAVIAHPLLWAATHARRNIDAAAFLAAALAAAIVMAIASQFVPVMVEKTLLFSLVFFIPLLAATLAALPLPWRTALLLAVALLQAPGLWAVLAGPRHGEDWSALAAALEPDARAGWAVAVRSGFDAVSLERYLPQDDPARPRISITPRIGTELNRQAALLMSSATPIPEQATAAQLCAALGSRADLLLIDRQNRVLERERGPAMALLAAAGGTLTSQRTLGSLLIQRWPGVCAPPAPTAPP